MPVMDGRRLNLLPRSCAVKKFAALAIVAGLGRRLCPGQEAYHHRSLPLFNGSDANPAASTAPLAPMASYMPTAAMASPDTVSTQTPTGGASGSSYTVKKGDTLYKIARDHYGDGKRWQQIASANPGVSPQSLKVGQSLVIP